MISAIILSAGLSSRFGTPKALAMWDKENRVLQIVQNVLLTSGIEQIIVVLGANSTETKSYILNHKSTEFVYNKDYKFGQTSSFKTGIKTVNINSEGIILLPVDYPAIKAETVKYLVDVFYSKRPDILIPSFEGRRGHPPIFSAGLKNVFLSMDNDMGINSIFKDHEYSTLIMPVDDPGVITTFNTKEEFDNIRPK